MPAFAPAALATAVVVSALGAVVLCILVVLYGFTPSDEDFPASGRGRLLLTRVGHAIAAACFTATAILIAIVLVQQRTPTPGSVAAPLTTVPGTAAIGEQIARQESRLVRTEARIRELEEALRRRDAERPAPAVERPAPAVERRVSAPSRQRPAATDPSASTTTKPAPSSSPGRASGGSGGGESTPPAASPPSPRAAEPPAAPEAEPTAARQPSGRGFDISNKLRDDWRDIQRGVGSAGDDFRSAVGNLKRRLLGE
jgi:hypothetical protein